jgi:hypothetical protein
MASEDGMVLRVEREGLQYRKGGRSVNVGAYGRWARGAVIEFIVNGRWNPPRSGPVLAESDLADVEKQVIAYAQKNGVIPRISVDWS